MTRRGVRVLGAATAFVVVLLAAGLWLGSELVLRPAWYEHRTPEQGLAPRDDTWGTEVWNGFYHDPRTDFDLAFEEVEFPAVDGATLRGWYVPGRSGATAGVVTVHGAGSDRRDFLRHLPLLHDAGYPVLLFDCREHGISDGAGRGVSLGFREHRDVSSAVAFAKDARGLERVAVLGTSQGGASVILAAAADRSIDAAIAENPFTSVSELIRANAREPMPPGFLEALTALAIWRVGGRGEPSPLDVIGQIAPRPLLLMHGTADAAIPVEQTQRLAQRAGEPLEVWIAPGAEHARLFDAFPDEFRKRVVGFLARWLPLRR